MDVIKELVKSTENKIKEEMKECYNFISIFSYISSLPEEDINPALKFFDERSEIILRAEFQTVIQIIRDHLVNLIWEVVGENTMHETTVFVSSDKLYNKIINYPELEYKPREEPNTEFLIKGTINYLLPDSLDEIRKEIRKNYNEDDDKIELRSDIFKRISSHIIEQFFYETLYEDSISSRMDYKNIYKYAIFITACLLEFIDMIQEYDFIHNEIKE